jgi:uncharacterized protein YneF (UPF0154 family)
VRPWIIWLTIILLLLIVILLGLYIDAKFKLFNDSRLLKHFNVPKAGRKRK